MPSDFPCVVTNVAIALQKTSKIKRSPYRKSQKQSDRLAENLKNNAIACMEE
ncbi:MAG: hypothetical protein V7L01_15555 [Nostoc sp.]|uniref:hypothetical protein n=1 Tax=Nostoc sp. TaxID=1180 RepID=UPI002FF8960E